MTEAFLFYRNKKLHMPFKIMEYMQLPKEHCKILLLTMDSVLDRLDFIVNHPEVTTLPIGGDNSALDVDQKIKIHDLCNMVGHINRFKKTEMGDTNPWYNRMPILPKRTVVKPIPFSMLHNYSTKRPAVANEDEDDDEAQVVVRNPVRNPAAAKNEEFECKLHTTAPARRKRNAFTYEDEMAIFRAVFGKYHRNGDRDWSTAWDALCADLQDTEITLQQMKDKFNNLKKKHPKWEDMFTNAATSSNAGPAPPARVVNPRSTGRFAAEPKVGTKRLRAAKACDTESDSDEDDSEDEVEVVYAESDSEDEEEDESSDSEVSSSSLLASAAVSMVTCCVYV